MKKLLALLLAVVLCLCMGLVSLGNGYWYWDGAGDTQDCLKLFHMDGFDAKTGAVGKAKNITDANLADYVATETAAGTLTSTVEDAKRTLQTRVTKTEQNYPTNAAGYSDASWTALQNALSGAKAVLADSSATAEQADAAMETLKTALKGMRKTAAFEPVLAAAKDEITRMSRTLYGAYIAKVEDAIANSASYSQTKLDDCVTSLEPLRAAQNPTVAAEFDSYTENVPTNTSIDLKNKGWELLKITVPTGQTAKVTADGKVIRTLTAGTYNVPIANVASMRIDGTADASVCRYEDLRTIAGITVDGESIYGFDQSILAYTVKIPTTATKPPKVGVKKLASLDVTVDIQQATMENKTATITVTRKDNGVVTVYTVKFVADSSQNPTFEPAPPRSVYLSDLPAPSIAATATSSGVYSITLKPTNGVYGKDGKGQVTFQKGFTVEPLIMKQAPTGYTEETYRNSFINQENGKKYINYSSVTWDIEGKGYTSFDATVGTRYGGSTFSDVTINFYVDGVKVDAATRNYVGTAANAEQDVASKDVHIEIPEGAKTFTIQLDPYGQGKLQTTSANSDQGKPDFARQDITIFGNARFNIPDTEALIGELTPL